MNKRHNNKSVPVPQGNTRSDGLIIALNGLSSRELTAVSDLVYWSSQPQTAETDVILVHFWLTLPDRLTDDEYRRFCEQWDVANAGWE